MLIDLSEYNLSPIILKILNNINSNVTITRESLDELNEFLLLYIYYLLQSNFLEIDGYTNNTNIQNNLSFDYNYIEIVIRNFTTNKNYYSSDIINFIKFQVENICFTILERICEESSIISVKLLEQLFEENEYLQEISLDINFNFRSKSKVSKIGEKTFTFTESELEAYFNQRILES